MSRPAPWFAAQGFGRIDDDHPFLRSPCAGCDAPHAEHEVEGEIYCDLCAARLVLMAQRCLGEMPRVGGAL